MKFGKLLVVAATALAACAPSAGPTAASRDACARFDGDGMVVAEAWVRPAAKGQMSAVYAAICNLGVTDDALIGASSEAAEAVELHASAKSAVGVASMTALPRLAAPAGGNAALKPGGAHLMLIGLKDAIEPGSEISITFEFENSPPVTVSAVAKMSADAHAGQ